MLQKMANDRKASRTPVPIATVLLLLASHLPSNGVLGYSRGAPDTACGDLMPGHGLVTQGTPSPYTIAPGAASVEGGKRMLVTLHTRDDERGFMGFLVQARNPDDESQIVGTFFTTDHSYLTCGKGFNNAVTHSSSTAKPKVLLEWEAPSDYSGDVVFKGTFVKTYDTYWVGVTSEKVTITNPPGSQGGPAALPPAPAPAPAPVPSPVPSPAPVPVPVPVPAPVPAATNNATTTTTTEFSASVSPDVVDTVSPENPGDFVINVVDAPGVDGDIPVVENDNGVATNGGEGSVLTPTLVFSPSSPASPTLSTSPASPSSPLSSTTTSSSSSSSSSNSSPTTADSFSSITDNPTSSSVTESSPAEDEPEPERNVQGTGTNPRRRFGLSGRFKTTTAATVETTTTTTASPKATSARVPIENLPPGVASLYNTMQNIYLGCKANKGCYGFPSGCENSENCQMLTTYAKVSSGYRFEIMGDAGSNAYVAVGLSDDQKMGDDSVMACASINGAVDVLMGFNVGKSNELLSNAKYGLSDIKTAGVDGRIYCSFVRQALTQVNNINFDLEAERFHLMLAKGPASANKLGYHQAREVSAGTSSMTEFAALEGGSSSDLFLKLHACFMIGAWVCAASCGILLARYYKQTWLDNKCCGIDQWFHFHRLFMILTWGLTIAGFVLIVIYEGGWTEDPVSENPHPVIGIVSIGLCFIQPFMALCRCKPTHKRRPVFNWLHWFVGNSAQILGLTAIFFGFDLIHAPKWTWFILIIFIAFHCIVHLILSIGQCISDSRGDKSNNVFPLKEMNGSRSPLHPVDKREDAPGGTFRKTMLAIYLIVVWLITALLMLIVVAGEQQLRDWKLLFWEK
ncbi:putative ferric-chelate reductase 1 homolog isoform X1 [Macrobrachium rosenbergii]|uniref:putative ferric-chelate reductase 1 homolog isoform X1 n=1 Tax=Macrobrachium rosenbergii TaxID=79674 RepID=UPI0034D77202